jgi:hypothetical protein
MKQIKTLILILLALISMASSCEHIENGHKYINMVNKSDRDIRCQMIWQGIITPADTIYECYTSSVLIKTDSTNLWECGDFDRGKSWEYDFKVIPYIQFLIVDADTYDNIMAEYGWGDNGCDSIRKYVSILHRYQLTLQDLQRMNWTVVYPPDAE